MALELSPQTQQYVDQQVALGRYSSPEAVIDAAVGALRDSEQQRDELRAFIRPAIEEANRGETLPADAERIKRLGRQLLASLKESP